MSCPLLFRVVKKALRRDILHSPDEEQNALMDVVQHTLSMNHTHTYFVTKHGKYTHQNVEFRITDDIITVTTFNPTRSLLQKSRKVNQLRAVLG